MLYARNILISAGVYRISQYLFKLSEWGLVKLNGGTLVGLLYEETALLIAWAAIAGTLVSIFAVGAKPQRWAWFVAVLFVLPAAPFYVSHLTTFEFAVAILFGAVPVAACIGVARHIAILRYRSPNLIAS